MERRILKTQFRIATALAAVGTLACTADSTTTRVARAHTFEFTASDAVRLIGPETELPAEIGVVQTVADLWIDYTLLAWAWEEDSTFSQLDLDPIVEERVDQEMIIRLRDQVISPDTMITEADLRSLFDTNAPGVRARARHIMLMLPDSPSDAQRDSVRAEMQGIRDRIARGASFADMARQFSQDRGSGQQGGDLGWFERGDMVRPFDEAVFALNPGEMSEVFETPYGVHVVQLQELESPTFEDARVEYRQRIIAERTRMAESTYIAGVFDAADAQVTEGAAELVRELARDPRQQLSRRAAGRVLVRYDGGEVTVGEVQDLMRARDADYRLQVINAPDDVVEGQVLDARLQRELLADRAREAGITGGEMPRDSLEMLVRERFKGAIGSVGLLDALRAAGGDDRREAVRTSVDRLMQDIVAGTTNVIPLGPISLTLRRQYRNEMFEAGLIATVTRLNEIRGPQGTGTGQPAASAPTPPPADSTGN